MGLIDNYLQKRKTVASAVQDMQKNNQTELYSSLGNWEKLALGMQGAKGAGKYDNFYENTNRIVTGAAKYPFYYTIDNEVADPDKNIFAYYIKNPNESFPQRKVAEQIYTELITHGYTDIFFWRKDGKAETRLFEDNKQYKEDTFRGFTLVSGYDAGRLSKEDKKNIVRITYGASQANVFMGYSPTQAAMSWRKLQDALGLHTTKFAENAGMPIGTFIISTDNGEEYVKIKNELNKRTIGAKNNGKVLFSWKPSLAKDTAPQIQWVQFTSKDVQDYVPQMEFSDKKIGKAFGVPGTIKGSNDGENYATASVSKQNFTEWTIKPLVDTLKDQLDFHLRQRFAMSGEIRVDVEIPELADESLVRIQATQMQVTLFDNKIAEGYTAESVVKAYNLPERFLLLEQASDNNQGNQSKAKKVVENEFTRHYQNVLTAKDKKELEDGFYKILSDYRDFILANGLDGIAMQDFENLMTAHFADSYKTIFEATLPTVAHELAEILETVDISELELTDDEIKYAQEQYAKRVHDFSESFSKQINEIEGTTLQVRSVKSESHVKMVQVTEAEHTRIVSELKTWTKAQEEFPVRVYKTWHIRPGACELCQSLADIRIDVTELFIDNPNVSEIYEVSGGGAHQQCRCYVQYEMVEK